MADIETVIQSSEPGEIVALFKFDASFVGGQIYYFTAAAYESSPVVFGGVTYTPIDIEFTDMETTGTGSLPQPKARISNTNQIIQSMINTYGDLVGCTIQRVRTFRRFLDGQEDADSSAYFGPDVFRVERKSAENMLYVEWELSASIDQEGKLLPGRQCLRDVCTWRYRRYNATTGQFDYSKATCPYTGSAYFNASGVTQTEPAADKCGRKLSDCRLRFGQSSPLPYGGFPGVARVRL